MDRKFPLGQVVSTPGALDALARAGQEPWPFISRHVAGDWNDWSGDPKHLPVSTRTLTPAETPAQGVTPPTH